MAESYNAVPLPALPPTLSPNITLVLSGMQTARDVAAALAIPSLR